MELIGIIIVAIFVNNVVFSQFLGICPFLGVSKKVDTAIGMSFAVMFVLTIASIVTFIVQKGILEQFGLEYLQTITLDRKSTRLNSSHVRISYAVFCLKKKKNTNSKLRLISLVNIKIKNNHISDNMITHQHTTTNLISPQNTTTLSPQRISYQNIICIF